MNEMFTFTNFNIVVLSGRLVIGISCMYIFLLALFYKEKREREVDLYPTILPWCLTNEKKTAMLKDQFGV